MAVTGLPYVSDAVDRDRKNTATDEADRMDCISGSGVVFKDGEADMPNSLLVTKHTGAMGVYVAPGKAIIAGHMMKSTAQEAVPLADGHATYNRYDIIVAESNENTNVRFPRFQVVEGEPAESPEDPEITNDGTVDQIPLCRVLVPAQATSIDVCTLTDLRAKGKGKHGHAIGDVDGLQNALGAKADTQAVSQALLGKADAQATQQALEGKSDSGHTHASLAALTISGGLAVETVGVVNVLAYPANHSEPSPAGKPQGTLLVKYTP